MFGSNMLHYRSIAHTFRFECLFRGLFALRIVTEYCTILIQPKLSVYFSSAADRMNELSNASFIMS